MADDVWSALAHGALGFTQSQAGKATGTTFTDAGTLVSSLFGGAQAGTTKDRLDQLQKDIKAVQAAVKPVIDAVKQQVDIGIQAVQGMAAALAKSPFTWADAGQAATKLAVFLTALDTAIDIIAKKIAEPETNVQKRQQIVDEIHGIKEPWIAPFRTLAADASKGFDALCHALLGIDNAGQDLANILQWNRDTFRISAKLLSLGRSQVGDLSFDGTVIEAFVSYQDPGKLGITVTSKLMAGLLKDPFLAKIMPGNAQPQTDALAITLDTKDGLTFGDGPNKKLVLPVRFSAPGIELRELAIAEPQNASGRIDLMVTVAGKLGDVLGVVADGGGLSVTWKGDAGGIVDVKPKPPAAVGLKVNAGVVKGGGYLAYNETTSEYGGVLDLKFTEVGLTAEGLLHPGDPFSFVIVMGIHFLPRIELGFGFTLNGLGGLLAINRMLSTDALVKGLRDGAVSSLLFPDDPIMAAPGILQRLGDIFPPGAGSFVVGPIVELGWGSQTGFVQAKVGIVLVLPDPAIVIMGALQVVVPSVDTPEKLRIIDLRAEIFAEITPDFFLVRASLANSKVAGITISGDMGLLIRWSGDGAFALSVGGFFPKYTPPPELAGLKPIAIEMSPPVPVLTVRATGYFAITANSLQFGGSIRLKADLDVASAEGWLSVDALFVWSPHFRFAAIVDAGIQISAFGESIAGVTFHGELSGVKPWHLEGHASVHILFWDVSADIGPIDWGDHDDVPPAVLHPREIVATALGADDAWTTTLPAGSEMIVRLVEDSATPLLLHPLGALQAKQIEVPLEQSIDRIGSAPVNAHRVNLANPTIGGQGAAAVSNATDMFPPGHFINLTQDQQACRPGFEEFISGMRVAAAAGAAVGRPATGVTYEWDTVFPRTAFPRIRIKWTLTSRARLAFSTNAVARSVQSRGNPYLPIGSQSVANQAKLNNAGLVAIRRVDDLARSSAIPAGMPDIMTTTAAASIVAALAKNDASAVQLVARGFAA